MELLSLPAGFKVLGLGLRVLGLGHMVLGLGFWDPKPVLNLNGQKPLIPDAFQELQRTPKLQTPNRGLRA